ncbi:MAG: cation:proton antiporter [Longimicrobiales bacterium]
MRAVFILLLLLGGMHQILPLGQQGLGAETLLAFGFLILAAWTVAELVKPLRFPHIVAFLVAGIIFGPHGLGTVTADATARLNAVSQLAISMIAFLAGAELSVREVKERGVALLKIVSVEMLVTFTAVLGLLLYARPYLDFLTGLSPGSDVAFAILFAAVATAHSPAVTLAILSETRARGVVARTTLGAVLVSDVAVVLLVTAAVAAARFVSPPADLEVLSLANVSWQIGGALLVGSALGLAISAYIRFVHRELILFGVLIAFLGGEIARVAQVDVLLALIVAGFLTENLAPGNRGDELRVAMQRSAAPVFVVFFALAGAKIDLKLIASLGAILVPIFLVRALGIYAGTRIGAHWAGLPNPARRVVWMGLISQAGVAIGLATVVGEVYPGVGPIVRNTMLALIALNELIGPILFRRALVVAGEVEEPRLRGTARPELEPTPSP